MGLPARDSRRVLLAVASVLLVASPNAGVAPTSVLVLEPKSDGFAPGVSRVLVAAIADTLAQDLRLRVLTSRDVHDLISLAAEQQLSGCDSSSCVSEVADALGASTVVFADVARLGGDVVLSLRLFDAATGETLARQTARAPSTTELERAAPAAARALIADLASPRTLLDRPLVIAGGAVAVAAVAGAVALGGWSAALATTLYADPRAARADKTFAYGALVPIVVAAGACAAVAAGGGAFAFIGSEGP
jgi:hypothetical protein